MQVLERGQKRIVVAMDSLKGSLTAAEATAAVARGARKALPAHWHVAEQPLADGGEGTLDIISKDTNATLHKARVADSLMRPTEAHYAITPQGTAIIELAQAAGICKLVTEELNPFETTTYGVGQLILEAHRAGARQFVVALGGSATNDGGAGLLAALGARFISSEGKPLIFSGPLPKELSRIDMTHIDEALRNKPFTLLCDVDNPLCGPNGASTIFAPQKGADVNDISVLDDALRHYADVMAQTIGSDFSETPGAGAAGGTAFALLSVFKACLKPGSKEILQLINISEILQDASVVITGEGKVDRTTLLGKAPSALLNAARELSIPVVALGGAVEDIDMLLDAGFAAVMPIVTHHTPLNVMLNPSVAIDNLEMAAFQILKLATLDI